MSELVLIRARWKTEETCENLDKGSFCHIYSASTSTAIATRIISITCKGNLLPLLVAHVISSSSYHCESSDCFLGQKHVDTYLCFKTAR